MGRNAFLILAARLLPPSASFAIVYLLGLRHGVAPVGQFNTAMAMLALFQLFSGLGLDTLLTREAAREPRDARALIRGALGMALPISLASMAAATSLAWGAGYGRATVEGILIGSAALPAFAAASILDAVFIGLGRARTVAGMAVLESLLRGSLSVAVILTRPSLQLLMLAHVIGKGVTTILYAVPVARLPRPEAHSAPRRMAFGLFVGILAVYAIFWRADLLLLSRIRGDYEAGIYSMAGKVSMVFLLPTSSLVAAALPALASAWKSDREAFSRIFHRVSAALGFYLIPVVAVLVARGADVFALLGLGPRFSASGPVLSVLALVLAVMSFIELTFRTMLAAGLEREGLGNGIRSSLACVAVVGIGAWKWGCIGVAWALLGAAAFDLAQDLWYARRIVSEFWRPMPRLLVQTLLVGAFTIACRNLPLIPFLALIGLGHAALSHVTGLMRAKDIRALGRNLFAA